MKSRNLSGPGSLRRDHRQAPLPDRIPPPSEVLLYPLLLRYHRIRQKRNRIPVLRSYLTEFPFSRGVLPHPQAYRRPWSALQGPLQPSRYGQASHQVQRRPHRRCPCFHRPGLFRPPLTLQWHPYTCRGSHRTCIQDNFRFRNPYKNVRGADGKHLRSHEGFPRSTPSFPQCWEIQTDARLSGHPEGSCPSSDHHRQNNSRRSFPADGN